MTRIGLFGVSMGAKIGTMATASDSRIEGAVLCIGGANLEDVIVRGRDGELDTYRNALLEKHGGDLSSLRGALSEAFATQRITDFAAQAASKPLMMVAARFDRVVPWSESVRLYEALGRPPRMTLPCGHYSAALFVPLIRRRALHFFNTLLRDEG